MKYLASLLLIIITLGNTECEPDGGTPTNPPPGDPTTAQVCYPSSTCLEATSLALVEPGYGYGDPNSAIGFDPDPIQYRQPLRMVNLEEANAEEDLAQFFKVRELMALWKGRFGMFSPTALLHINEIRDRIGEPLVITSGFRSPKYNDKVGGAHWSRHKYGDAVDMYSPGASLAELKKQCEEEGASFIQVYKSHIHCDWRNEPLNEAFFGPEATLLAMQLGPPEPREAPKPKVVLRGKTLSCEGMRAEDPGAVLITYTVQGREVEADTLTLAAGTHQVRCSFGGTLSDLISVTVSD